MSSKKPRSPEAGRKYTVAFDGACLDNPGPGGYAGICVDEKTGEEKIVRGGDPETTNNRMELTAAIEALNALPPGSLVAMIGDSQYVIRGTTEWLRGWIARGWRRPQGKPVVNANLWQALVAAEARHASISWEWVRGHNGHPLNERADQIASQEARRARRSLRGRSETPLRSKHATTRT